jgi:hypothetical protein
VAGRRRCRRGSARIWCCAPRERLACAEGGRVVLASLRVFSPSIPGGARGVSCRLRAAGRHAAGWLGRAECGLSDETLGCPRGRPSPVTVWLDGSSADVETRMGLRAMTSRWSPRMQGTEGPGMTWNGGIKERCLFFSRAGKLVLKTIAQLESEGAAGRAEALARARSRDGQYFA